MGINEIIQIGNQIKEIRKLLGFTQKEIALRAGIPYTTYSNYENNNREPNSEQLRKITNALNVPLSVLLENNELSRNYRSRLREYNDIQKNTSYSAEYKQQILDKYDSELERIKKELELEDKQREEAARKAPKFTDKAEVFQKKSKLFTRSKKGKVIEDGKPPKFTAPSTTYAPQEAYKLLHSLIDKEGIDDREREEVSQQLKKILGSFKGLNEIGRKKAVERIEELYMIPKYIFDNFPDKID